MSDESSRVPPRERDKRTLATAAETMRHAAWRLTEGGYEPEEVATYLREAAAQFAPPS